MQRVSQTCKSVQFIGMYIMLANQQVKSKSYKIFSEQIEKFLLHYKRLLFIC